MITDKGIIHHVMSDCYLFHSLVMNVIFQDVLVLFDDLNEVGSTMTVILYIFENDEINHLLMLFEFVN